MIKKNWTLEVHEIGEQNRYEYDCVEYVIECRKCEDCIKMFAVIFVGWTVLALSVVGMGKTLHWIEKQWCFGETLIKGSIVGKNT